MLRFGIVDTVNSKTGQARVIFEEDDFVSDWLPVVQLGSTKKKSKDLPSQGDQVACLMDQHSENGVILGATYNTQDLPPFAGDDDADKSGVVYENGDEFSYDAAVQKLLYKVKTLEFSMDEDGFTIKKGTLTLKEIMTDFINLFKVHIHATGVGPSAGPTDQVTITANQDKIDDLFTE